MKTRNSRRRFGLAFFLISLVLSVRGWALDIEGVVKMNPPWPEPVSLTVDEKHAHDCGPAKTSPKLILSEDGFVVNAVVRLEGNFPKGEDPDPGKDIILDQIQCEFVPHVVLLPLGAALTILNSEEILHNVRAFDESATMLFNDAMPKKGQTLKKRFSRPGRLVVRCGIHPWMHALVVVQAHRYYSLSDDRGRFRIANIPPAKYNLRVWHEVLGDLVRPVGPEDASVVLTYSSLT